MPNCVSALLVQASVNFANAMVIEAGLSGRRPPRRARSAADRL